MANYQTYLKEVKSGIAECDVRDVKVVVDQAAAGKGAAARIIDVREQDEYVQGYIPGATWSVYLAAAGVGTIGLVDDDVVDLSNLQRQIIHAQDRIGMPKVESARIMLGGLNPDVKVVPHPFRLSSENILELIADYDVIV